MAEAIHHLYGTRTAVRCRKQESLVCAGERRMAGLHCLHLRRRPPLLSAQSLSPGPEAHADARRRLAPWPAGASGPIRIRILQARARRRTGTPLTRLRGSMLTHTARAGAGRGPVAHPDQRPHADDQLPGHVRVGAAGADQRRRVLRVGRLLLLRRRALARARGGPRSKQRSAPASPDVPFARGGQVSKNRSGKQAGPHWFTGCCACAVCIQAFISCTRRNPAARRAPMTRLPVPAQGDSDGRAALPEAVPATPVRGPAPRCACRPRSAAPVCPAVPDRPAPSPGQPRPSAPPGRALARERAPERRQCPALP
jgi:hypothetical protein